MAEYIEREAAKEYLFRSIGADPEGVCKTCIRDEYNCQYDRSWTLMDFCEKIENIGYVPAADVAPVRHGRWERHFSRPCVYADMFWHCSVCGYKNAESFADVYHHYCPNCGAKMEVQDG